VQITLDFVAACRFAAFVSLFLLKTDLVSVANVVGSVVFLQLVHVLGPILLKIEGS
jgi:hypothetical protein